MESLMKSDIFFFISSVSTIILTIFGLIILFYLIKASKNLYELSEAIKGNFKESKEFIAELKERLEDNIIFRFFFPLIRKKRHSTGKGPTPKK